MRTLIGFTSTYGTAEECAKLLAAQLVGEVDVINLAKEQPDPGDYDRIILGGSIYMGQIQKANKSYCETHSQQLLQKPLGLYICSGRQGDEAAAQWQAAFPTALLEHAQWVNTLGYRYNLQRMSFLHRMIVKKLAKVTQDQDALDRGSIQSLAAAMESCS